MDYYVVFLGKKHFFHNPSFYLRVYCEWVPETKQRKFLSILNYWWFYVSLFIARDTILSPFFIGNALHEIFSWENGTSYLMKVRKNYIHEKLSVSLGKHSWDKSQPVSSLPLE